MFPKVTDLSGSWQLRMTDYKAGDAAVIPTLEDGWIPARVPGDVHVDLLHAGQIPDFHIGDNACQCQWVARKDWWYCKRFVAPAHSGSYTELQMDGLDVYATIWLNGIKLGSSDNAFIPWRKRVDDILKPGEENVLLVCLESVAERLGRTEYTGMNSDWGKYGRMRSKVRKPQYSFGWDWAPSLASIGICREVRLITWEDYHIADVYVRAQVSGQVDVFVSMSHQVNAGELEVQIQGHGFTAKQIIPLHGANHYANFQIDEPALWWPREFGAPNLYDYKVIYTHDDQVRDLRQGRFGIREVKTFEEGFPGGMSFGFVVNGAKIFIKGSNWVPTEIFPGAAKPERVLADLDRAKEANLNLVRVWGGGNYESDLFYNWCDENGMMVWEDFMFAGTLYDVSEPAFRRSVIREAEYQVKRLRNHPSIVVWCGTNEDGRSWGYHDVQNDDPGMDFVSDKRTRLELDDELFSMILRGTVDRFTQEPYIESSPQSHEDFGNHPASGNCHRAVAKYCLDYPADEYRNYYDETKVVSFNSEFCIQGPARATSMRRFIPAQNLWPPDSVWQYHLSQGSRGLYHYERHITCSEGMFGPVDSLETYCKYGTAAHAEFTRAEYEFGRRNKWACGGTMVWMHNDCWPTANWSLFDYYGVVKPAFYSAKRACVPVLPLLFPRQEQVEFYIANDTLQSYQGEAIIGQETLTGAVLWQQQLTIDVPANASTLYYTKALLDLVQDVNSVLFVDTMLNGKALQRVVYFPFLWKQVQWPQPHVQVEVLGQSHHNGRVHTQVRVSTDVFVHRCHLDVLPLEDHILSDNFFDLCAGKSQVVEITSPGVIGLEDIHVGHWLTTWR